MKDSMRCKSCKHWDRPEDPSVYPLGGCTHEKVSAGEWWPGFATDACKCSDLYVAIETGPDFGCIHWGELERMRKG